MDVSFACKVFFKLTNTIGKMICIRCKENAFLIDNTYSTIMYYTVEFSMSQNKILYSFSTALLPTFE